MLSRRIEAVYQSRAAFKSTVAIVVFQTHNAGGNAHIPCSLMVDEAVGLVQVIGNNDCFIRTAVLILIR